MGDAGGAERTTSRQGNVDVHGGLRREDLHRQRVVWHRGSREKRPQIEACERLTRRLRIRECRNEVAARLNAEDPVAAAIVGALRRATGDTTPAGADQPPSSTGPFDLQYNDTDALHRIAVLVDDASGESAPTRKRDVDVLGRDACLDDNELAALRRATLAEGRSHEHRFSCTDGERPRVHSDDRDPPIYIRNNPVYSHP